MPIRASAVRVLLPKWWLHCGCGGKSIAHLFLAARSCCQQEPNNGNTTLVPTDQWMLNMWAQCCGH